MPHGQLVKKKVFQFHERFVNCNEKANRSGDEGTLETMLPEGELEEGKAEKRST